MKIKRIAYYISSHGYGHAARSAVVLDKLLEKYEVRIKTKIPREFFKLYLKGRYSVTLEPVDVGCQQGEFIQIDPQKTFAALEKFYASADQRLNDEIKWLRSNHIELVLSDVSSLPLKAAHEAGIPALLLGNFTWHDIYSHFPGAANHADLLDRVAGEYSLADLYIQPQCQLKSHLIPRKEEVGFLAIKGRNIQEKLQREFQKPLTDTPVIFIYMGDNRSHSIQWDRLGRLNQYVFLTRDPLPDHIPNLYVLDERFRYPDLIASSDIVFTKAGYSTLATAFSHGKPVVSCVRDDFHEFETMKDYMTGHGVGLILENSRFYNCDWADSIERAQGITVDGKVPLQGERQVKKIVDDFLI